MFNFGYFLENWHYFAYALLVGFATIAYIRHFLDHKSKMVTAQSLMMLVLLLVLVIATRMERLGDTLSSRLENMEKLNGYARIEKIGNADSMFARLLRELRVADSQIHVTSIRHENPEDFEKQSALAKRWFDELAEWPNHKFGRTLSRVIGVPDAHMKTWFDDLCKKNERKDNTSLRALEWDGKTPIINVVVFDQKETYLVFSPPNGLLAATEFYHISDPNFAQLIVRGYFTYLYQAGTSCR